jgi:large subunit ribosomal protein L3
LSIGLIGKKSGMSRLFLEDGESIPVTAVSVCGNFIADIKRLREMVIMHLLFQKLTSQITLKNLKVSFSKKSISSLAFLLNLELLMKYLMILK